ncbi:hypothetical protein E2F43_18465 [Seongchinamella unica]|uniref:Uncharacterized protein n=1 Tax=Seongchinamella unica TaxID=2547392 RepID=A0A4V2ZWT7_9GAMM|nr:porin [Seongchinamella unica]TDG11371.1 hypothetical protein E2F43_18465 [Seongchinamella unica]
MRHLVTLIAALYLLTAMPGYAQQLKDTFREPVPANKPRSILLRNVVLIDPARPAETLRVNILVKNDRLDLISEDLIPLNEAEIAYDGRDGVVLGQLNLGEPASFLLLDGDPREDVGILLDTRVHGIFAMREGKIVRNRLLTIIDETAEERRRSELGWLAYSPPPLAVPLDYQDTGKLNRFETAPVSGIFTGGLGLDRMYWLDQSADSRQQVGDLKGFEGGEIRALRMGAFGTINFNRPWVWALYGATHSYDKGFDDKDDDTFSWTDVRLDIPIAEKASLSIGKQKEPISMERLMSLVHLPMQERSSVADALLPSRNVGVVISSTILNDRVALAGGAFNNWLDRDQPNSFSDNTINYVGRATWVPFEDDSRSSLLHLGLAYRYSDAKESTRVSTEPEFNQSPDFISSAVFNAEELNTYRAETSWRSGRLWLHGEYTRTNVDAEALRDPTVKGYSVTASWSLSGEMRPYKKRVGVFQRLPIARTVNQNGWGAWEVAARYSTLDANDGLLEAGDMDIWSAGLNWWLSPYLNLNFNYRYITLDRNGLESSSQGINSRLLLMLE